MDIKGLKNQIAKWEKEVISLKEKAVKATGASKAKFEAKIKELKSKITDAKAKLKKLQSKGKSILDKSKKILGKLKK